MAINGNETKLGDMYRLFLMNTNPDNSKYLFKWINKCIKDDKVDKMVISQEIMNSMDRLVRCSYEGIMGQEPHPRSHHPTAESWREVR